MRNKIKMPMPSVVIRDGKAVVTAPDGCKVEFLGADLPQVVDDELNVHTPLTDTGVILSFICADAAGNKTECDVTVRISGQYGAAVGKKPKVLPEPAQWRPNGAGRVNIGDIFRISYSEKALKGCVGRFSDELCKLFGVKKEIVPSVGMLKGDMRFELSGKYAYLGKEGYAIRCDSDGILVEASAVMGAIWAGKTILQLFAQSGFPYGEMRDYPRYPVRGCMLDVGRRPMTLEMLDLIVQRMAWYKMNDLQLHLSDNYIFLEHYSEKGDASTFDAYEAFRLESSLVNDKGETATAKDHSYCKEEFRSFIERSAERGVRIVPEIDVPAHDLSLTKAFPQYMVKDKTSPLMSKRPLSDHLDVGRPETVAFIKSIFDDYTGGAHPVFGGDVTVHIGADEFLTDYGSYRAFINEIVPYIKKTNNVRLWGGLTWIKDSPITAIIPEAIEGVQMNLWSNAWADGREMYDMGYELINTIDHFLYMVPNGSGRRGAYTDLLDKKKIFKDFKPNRVRLKEMGKYIDLPAGDKRVLGAAFAIWHDNIDKKASGLTQGDTFDRFLDCAPLIAEKTWGHCTDKHSSREVDKAALAVGAPIRADMPLSGTIVYSESDGAEIKDGALHICGQSYASFSFDHLPLNTELTIDIKFNEIKPNAVIMESDRVFSAPYDVRITGNGKLGFTREGYEYEFDYTPPVGKRIKMTISARPLRTMLKIGLLTRKKAIGSYTHNGKVKRSGIKNSTFLIPCKRIGSASDAVNAEIYGISYKPL